MRVCVHKRIIVHPITIAQPLKRSKKASSRPRNGRQREASRRLPASEGEHPVISHQPTGTGTQVCHWPDRCCSLMDGHPFVLKREQGAPSSSQTRFYRWPNNELGFTLLILLLVTKIIHPRNKKRNENCPETDTHTGKHSQSLHGYFWVGQPHWGFSPLPEREECRCIW